MKHYLYLFMCLLAIGASSVTTSEAYAESSNVYAQLSSMNNQFPRGTQLITLEKIDKLSGIDHAEAKITIKEPGIYFVMAAGQAGVDKNQTTAGGFVDLWLIRNGLDEPNSGVRQFLETPQSTSVIVSQNILVFKAGDVLSLGYSASRPFHGFISIDSNNTQPSIPSMILSIYKIGS
jgi:hypothetical protein